MHLSTFILGSAALLIQLYSEKYQNDDLATTLVELDNDDNLPRIRTYDFIIVGGGAAGCVLANRLSEQYNVLLLEAGGTPVPGTRTPYLYDSILRHPSVNYKYASVPQMELALENGGIVRHTEGKMLGGSMSHNGMNHNRGSPLTYDTWATLLNDSSWEYKNVLKYFKKSENYKVDASSNQRGHGGLMTVRRNSDDPLLNIWLNAGAELGFKSKYDPNSDQMESYTALDVTQENGRRVSSYTAFIEPIEKSRDKLRIERYSYVSKILISKRKRAYGVAYTRHGIPQIAHAYKEVIMSCGTYGSPILLMVSGIGPQNILKEAGIPVTADLPVGKTMNDHFRVPLSFSISENASESLGVLKLSEKSLTEYHSRGQGILAYPLLSGQAFVVSSRAKMQGQSKWTDIQFEMGGMTELSIEVILTRAQTKGVLGLNTTSYKAGNRMNEQLAVIDHTTFHDPSDADVLLEGIKLALATMEDTTVFQKLGAKFIGEKHPGCSKFKFRTDEYWRCYIRQVGIPYSHASGTCRMGFGSNDKNAVLDAEFNVLGLSNLRVVDASAMPISPNANTAAPVIMMAEKASEGILKTWANSN